MEQSRNQNAKVDYRMFGEFKCKTCKRYWTSGHTWKNYGQYCSNCNSIVYSYRRRVKTVPKSNTHERKAHESAFCEKCIELNDLCTKYRTSKMNRNRKGRSKRYYSNIENNHEGERPNGGSRSIRRPRGRNSRYVRPRRGNN